MTVKSNLMVISIIEEILEETNMEMKDSKINEVNGMMRRELKSTTKKKEINQETLKKGEFIKTQDNDHGINNTEIRMIENNQDQTEKDMDQLQDKLKNKEDINKEIFNGEVQTKKIQEVKDKSDTMDIIKVMDNGKDKTNQTINIKVGEGKFKVINNGEVFKALTKMKKGIKDFQTVMKDLN